MDINLNYGAELDASQCARIREIKAKIVSMLDERHAMETAAATAAPSKFWSNTCACFDYLLDLPEQHFVRLRTHTYHLTSDNYLLYNGDPSGYRATWDLETAGVSDACKLNEPEGGIGFRYPDGRFISKDILRFQTVVSDLYRQDVLADLWSKKQRSYILEIGAGYGGLLHHLSRIVPNSTCIILDLPETLLFSATYLSLLNPDQKIYIYDKRDHEQFLQAGGFGSFDFVLLPNYLLPTLANQRFDLVLNIVSFGEMRVDQVEQYLDFIGKTCRGCFYSCNADRHPRNTEMTSIADLLGGRFDVKELQTPAGPAEEHAGTDFKRGARRLLKTMARSVGLLEPELQVAVGRPGYRRFVCTSAPLRHVNGTIRNQEDAS